MNTCPIYRRSGGHSYDATINYFNQLLNYVHNDTVIVVDDIYWSEEMIDAWKIIKADPRVSITIDLYFIGLVFFKKGQAKENFTILF